MAKPFDSASEPDDILGLIQDVHANTPAEQDRLERALGTLESTHRNASAAMQRFERTGRTGLGPQAAPPSAPALGRIASPSSEPAGRPESARASSSMPTRAPLSTEVTQMGPILQAPPPAAEADEPTRTAIARPERPIPVAEVLTGRGAEFVERGHTKTHIVHRKKNLPKK